MKSKKNFNVCRLLVAKFVDPQKANWPKEIKIAKKLLELYDKNFWISFCLDSKLTSLSWFLTKEGKSFLITQKKINSLEKKPPEVHIIQDVKIGEDVQLNKKPRTVFDFLNYGKK
jgi:hypothetical protein